MRISDWSSDVCSSDLLSTERCGMIDLHFVRTPNGHKASIMLEELGVPYRSRVYDMLTGEHLAAAFRAITPNRSAERRVGTECVSTCRSRWSPYPSKKTTIQSTNYSKPRNNEYK